LTKRIWPRLGLALLVLAAVALAGCKNAYIAPHEFDGEWSAPFLQQWYFNSDGGSYSSVVGLYEFDFTYASVDEDNQHILITITKVTGTFASPCTKVGAQV
jgi:hypothetical protein